MREKEATAILSAMGSEALSRQWKELSPGQQRHLCLQLQQIDLATLRLQQQMVHRPQTKKREVTPFTQFSTVGNAIDRESGLKMISQGMAGCLIVAGGQGSRLRTDGPKGKCLVTKVHKKSLFQLFAEKVKAAGKQAGRPLLLAIMTSPLNHQDTIDFFEENAYFGLNPPQISFFQQEMLPLLDQESNLFLETIDTLSMGPDGNGGALHQFFKCGLWNNWYSQGVRYLNFLPIDNPLADPFDAELFGYQQRQECDIVVKCTERKNPEENVGVLVMEKGKTAVIEYSELPQNERTGVNSDGTLLYSLANLSLFSFRMEFIKSVAESTHPGLHKAFKAVKYLDRNRQTVQAKNPMAWKFETFIFDLLPFASKVDALLYSREVCFSPLKNLSGNDSFETVAQALEQRDRQVLSAVTGVPCTFNPLEISQEFYYPTPELISVWKGKSISHGGYIEGLRCD